MKVVKTILRIRVLNSIATEVAGEDEDALSISEDDEHCKLLLAVVVLLVVLVVVFIFAWYGCVVCT